MNNQTIDELVSGTARIMSIPTQTIGKTILTLGAAAILGFYTLNALSGCETSKYESSSHREKVRIMAECGKKIDPGSRSQSEHCLISKGFYEL